MRALAARGLAACLLLAPLSAAAQSTPPILIVDRERALRDSASAAALAEIERDARIALRDENDQLRRSLEAEEAEIAAMREIAEKSAFEARVRAFDIRVRDARRESQTKGEALEARFLGARRALAAALEPVLAELLQETGAALIVDARTVLAAREGADFTDEVIRRFDARSPVSVSPEQPADE